MSSRLGVRASFTLLYGAALIITILLVSGGIYFFVRQALMGQVETHLRKDFHTIKEYLKNDPSQLTNVATHGPIRLFTVHDGTVPFVSSGDWEAENLKTAIDREGSDERLYSFRSGSGKYYSILIGNFELHGHTYGITVAHGEDSVRQTLKTLAFIILLILPMAVAMSLGIGYLIAGRVLAPISAITRKAQEIGAENLSERLPVGDNDDEFSRLASVFNQTFARIEESFARLRRFTADASHELRTPLAAIRSIGETVLHAPDAANSSEAIGSILEESDRLRQMVDSLLQLSRADSGEIELRREAIDLEELVTEAVELLCVLAEEKRRTLTLRVSATKVVHLDRTSMRQALINLLDNAIKYAPVESEITITVSVNSRGEGVIEIADRGMGIAEHDLCSVSSTAFIGWTKGGPAKWGAPALDWP